MLLTPNLKQAMEMLTDRKTREAAGIHQGNDYVFPRVYKDSTRHLRGSDCLRTQVQNLARKEELKCPEFLTSTQLRKYTATVSQIMALTNEELDWLAR